MLTTQTSSRSEGAYAGQVRDLVEYADLAGWTWPRVGNEATTRLADAVARKVRIEIWRANTFLPRGAGWCREYKAAASTWS